jgi:peptide deformylase
MTTRNIVTLPDPVLRRKAKPVTKFGKELQALIDDMIETMRQAPGVGLAAPQVSVSERLIVVEYGEEEETEAGEIIELPKKLFILANPEIVKTSEEKVKGIEGCLSIPGIVGEVERFESIQLRGLNRHGKPARVKAEGWLARIFQHEIDHLDGVLFPDRAERVWKPETELTEDQEV